MNIVTRGGLYAEGPGSSYELGDRYVKTIMTFLGIEDYDTIFADGLDIIGNDVETIVGAALKTAQAKVLLITLFDRILLTIGGRQRQSIAPA